MSDAVSLIWTRICDSKMKAFLTNCFPSKRLHRISESELAAKKKTGHVAMQLTSFKHTKLHCMHLTRLKNIAALQISGFFVAADWFLTPVCHTSFFQKYKN